MLRGPPALNSGWPSMSAALSPHIGSQSKRPACPTAKTGCIEEHVITCLLAAAGELRRKSRRQPLCPARSCTRPEKVGRHDVGASGSTGYLSPVKVSIRREASTAVPLGGCWAAASRAGSHSWRPWPAPTPGSHVQVCEVEVGSSAVLLEASQNVGGEPARRRGGARERHQVSAANARQR